MIMIYAILNMVSHLQRRLPYRLNRNTHVTRGTPLTAAECLIPHLRVQASAEQRAICSCLCARALSLCRELCGPYTATTPSCVCALLSVENAVSSS